MVLASSLLLAQALTKASWVEVHPAGRLFEVEGILKLKLKLKLKLFLSLSFGVTAEWLAL